MRMLTISTVVLFASIGLLWGDEPTASNSDTKGKGRRSSQKILEAERGGLSQVESEARNKVDQIIKLYGKATPTERDSLLLEVSTMNAGPPLFFEVNRKFVKDIEPIEGQSDLKLVTIKMLASENNEYKSARITVHYDMDLQHLLTLSEEDREDGALADDNLGRIKDELKERFRGGHVYFSGLHLIPQAAEAEVVLNVPDLIRWVLENKGINVTRGDFELGHRTVETWRTVHVPFCRRIRISTGNRFVGYLGWKPN